MTQHFVQYHSPSHGRPVPETFAAKTAKAVPVNIGDIVWLLTRKESPLAGQYVFAYWFRVDDILSDGDGGTRYTGREGHRFNPEWSVSTRTMPWFENLFERVLGRGSFGMRPIPSECTAIFEGEMQIPKTNVGPSTSADIQLIPNKFGSEDERQLRAVLTRRGQQDFRARLLLAYQRRCAVSESRVESLLEAAHIVPHAEGTDYRLSNGLLLRADLHTLFDLHLLGIDEFLRVHLHPKLKHSEYARYEGKRVESLPVANSDYPSAVGLKSRFSRFVANVDRTEAELV